MWLALVKAKNIKRDEYGAPWTWTSQGTIEEFDKGEDFLTYVENHISDLKDAAAFSGSASTITSANYILGKALKEKGLI